MNKSFKPLPQTVREKPGQKFKVMYRVASIACSGDRENTPTKGWDIIPGATNLSKMGAEILLEKWNEVHLTFEHAMIPMDQEIP